MAPLGEKKAAKPACVLCEQRIMLVMYGVNIHLCPRGSIRLLGLGRFGSVGAIWSWLGRFDSGGLLYV